MLRYRDRAIRYVLLTCLLLALPAAAAAETFEYDAAGRLSRILAEDGSVTHYSYDAVGNLVSVSAVAASFPPVVREVAPSQVRAGTSERIGLQGENLADVVLLAPDPAFALSDLATTAESLSFTLDTAQEAPLGDQVFRVQNADGEASFTLSVLPPLPVLGVMPVPLALPEDGSLRQILVTLSRADPMDRVVSLAIADPTIVELQTSSVTIPAGETEVPAALRGLTGGVTNLTLTSDGLATAVYSVYVTAEYGSINSTYATRLGVQVGDSDGGPGTDPGQAARSAWADPLGLAIGSFISGVDPWALRVGDVAVPLTVRGVGLQAVDLVTVEPAEGVTLSDLDVLADGSEVMFSVSVDANAARGPRRVLLGGADQPYAPMQPGADLLEIVAPLPTIDSLAPNHALRGTTAASLHIRGRHLEQALSVRFEPPDGIVVGTDLQSAADGRSLTLRYSVAPDAPLGERLLRVITPAGASSRVLGPHNRFEVVDQVLGVVEPMVSSRLGVQIGSTPQEPPGEGQILTPPLGLALGAVVSARAPAIGAIGTSLELELKGTGLQNATQLLVEPAEGIGVDAILADPLGEFVLAQLQIAADAPETVRRLRLLGADAEIPFADPAASAFLVTAPVPLLNAVSPNTLQIGAGAQTLTLYGANLERATRVDALLAQGLLIGEPSVGDLGDRLTVTIEAQADAAPGERVLIVTTPAGVTPTEPNAANRLILYQEALAVTTPLVAPVLGIEIAGAPGGSDLPVDPLAAPLVGIQVGEAAQPQAPPALVAAPLVGLVLGPFATRIQAPPLLLGDTYSLQVYGQALEGVDGAGVYPGWDLAVGTPFVGPDGTSLALSLTIPPDAALEPRSLRLFAGPDPIPFADPRAAVLGFAVGVPEIDSIQPIVAQPGDLVELVVRGHHLDGALSVLAEPANGLQFDAQHSVDPAGTELRIRLYVTPDAAVGPRTIRVQTRGGTSTSVASPANSFTVY